VTQKDNCSQLKIDDFKREFTLKQHTPIIHFQATQKGATLRATELKPKLDRFLIEQFKKHRIAYKDFLVNGQENALDYKVRIEPNKSGYDRYDKNLKNFFGNQGKGYNEKSYSKIYPNQFTITITSFETELLKKFEEHFAAFLATHNFGNRQSKGYGSFYLTEDSIGYQPIEDVLPNGTIYLEAETTDVTQIDEVIKYFWQRLKSGINRNFSLVKPTKNFKERGRRCKSEYKKAYIQKKYNNWDKSWIKQTFFANKEVSEHTFIRALLGLPVVFSYKKTNEPCRPSNEYLLIEDNYTINIYHKDISRIASPVHFKPIIKEKKTFIYILIEDKHIDLTKIGKSPFEFRKQFEFYFDFKRDRQDNSILRDRSNDPKFKTQLFPSFDSKKPQEYYNIPYKIKNTKNRDNEEKFSFKNQYERFEKFLADYCEKNNSNQYRAKKFTLSIPSSFDMTNILNGYINDELNNSFEVEINRNEKVKVDIALLSQGATNEQ